MEQVTVSVNTSENTPSNPLRCRVQGYEPTPDQELPASVLESVDSFLIREYEQAIECRDSRLLASAAWNHMGSWAAFTDAFKDRPGKVPATGLLLLAANVASQQVVGLSTALLRGAPEAVVIEDNYVGTATGVRGYGLGGMLVLLRDYILADKGVASYNAHVWEGSQRMYDRIGTQYTAHPADSVSANGAHRWITVSLDRETLARQCAEQLGIDPSNTLPEHPIDVSLQQRRLGFTTLAAAGA